MGDVIFKGDYQRKTKQIGIWVDVDIWETYKLLSREYGVDVSEEMRRVMTDRIRRLKDEIILAKDIA